MHYFTISSLQKMSAATQPSATLPGGDDAAHIYLIFRHSKPEVLTDVIRLLQARGFSLYIDQLPMGHCCEAFSSGALKVVRNQLASARYMLVIADNLAALTSTDTWLMGLFEGMKPGCVAGWPVLPSPAAEWRPLERLLTGCPLIVRQLTDSRGEAQTAQITLSEFLDLA